jgi:type IV pilus assembly protein PilF
MQIKSLLAAIAPVVLLVACAGNPQSPTVTKSLAAAKANTQLGIEYLRSGDLERSRHRLERAISMAPNHAPAHDAIAILYGQVGDHAAAEKHYRKSLRLDASNAATRNNYGQFLCKQGRYDEAESAFKKAADNAYYRTPWVPLTNAGICLLGVPDNARAEAYLRQALARQPTYAPALLNMGKISFAAGDFLSARGYVERYQQVVEHTADSLWLAIQTEYALKDHQAWGNYALQLKKDFPDSEQYLLLQEWENGRRTGN